MNSPHPATGNLGLAGHPRPELDRLTGPHFSKHFRPGAQAAGVRGPASTHRTVPGFI